MRTAPVIVAFSLLAASGLATPQAPKPAATEERPASPPAPGPRLNLKLDDPARYTRETPREGDGALPSLGGDARRLPATSYPTPMETTRPFPKDTERGER
jgi:hypothetical protein